MKDTARAVLRMAASLHQAFDKTECGLRAWKEHAKNCEAAIKRLADENAVPERPWSIKSEDD